MEITDILLREVWEKERVDFDYEKNFYEWLSLVPKLDLRGLGKISMVNYSTKPDEKDQRGLWLDKERGTPAHIEICVSRIMEDIPEDKRDDAELLAAHLAFELLRQVGRNSLQFRHGIPKQKHESYMTRYAEKIFREKFPGFEIKDGLPVRREA